MPTVQPGEVAPPFALPDEQGHPWDLRARLAAGPAVLVFYRGDW